MKLVKICKYEGKIKLLTGLSIKGSGSELSIGGYDEEVVKNPISGMPYIPGSSLKGKMRASLEMAKGLNEVCSCGDDTCMICKVFGCGKVKNKKSPTRIMVRDMELTEDTLKQLEERPIERGNFMENKAENSINRSTGLVGSPRFFERVPAGAEFQLKIALQLFEGDDEKKMKETVEKALELVEASYLGSSGSRGYGQVEFEGTWSEIGV